MVDFGEADDVLGPAGLIPTTRGIASAAGQSTRPEAKHDQRVRAETGASQSSTRFAGPVGGKEGHDDDSDEFVDAEEA